MLHKKEAEKQEIAPQPEEIKFSNGGGGEGPKSYFKSYSSVSSVVCKPDPENPGRQICKRVENSKSYDPISGIQSRHRESEDDHPTFG